METNQQDLLAKMEATIKTNREKDWEDVTGLMEKMNAKVDGRQEEMLARMQENTKSGQAEIRSTICAFRSNLKENIQCETRAAIQFVR
jgi:hypothetical protein